MEIIEGIYLGQRSLLMGSICFLMLISAVILCFKPYEKIANRFLAAFLVVVVLNFSPVVIGFMGAYDKWPWLSFYPFKTELYFGPLLYLHAYALMSQKKIGYQWLFLLPGVVQTSYYISVVISYPNYLDRWKYGGDYHSPYVSHFETFAILFSLLIFLHACWKLIKRYNYFLLQTQSAAQRFKPVWLNRFLPAISLVACILGLFLIYVTIFGRNNYTSEFPFQVLMAMIVCWLGIEAVYRINSRFPKYYVIEPPREVGKNWHKEGEKLKLYVLDNELFLDAELNLKSLASHMATNESYLSKTINTAFDMNFNSFINSLRVDYAKKLLAQSDKAILEIGLEAGFNSKATFNRVFKQISGLTPSKYRNLD